MLQEMANSTYGFVKKAAYGITPLIFSAMQVAPQIVLIDFKIQRICFGALAVLQGSLGLVKSHATDKVMSIFVDRHVEPVQYDLAATSLALIAGGTFLICDGFNALYNSAGGSPEEFAEQHKSELEQLCQGESEIGEWKKLAVGVHKAVFQHPELNGYVVKVPKLRYDQQPMIRHYENAKIAREIVKENGFKDLIIPDMHWVMTSCPIVFEERMELDDMVESTFPITNAEIELNDFIKISGFRDTMLRYCGEIYGVKFCGHNARFIKSNAEGPKIAVFDFDCREL